MKLFAIIPAAGLSRRMGQPKLTMQLAGRSVISRLLGALNHPAVAATTVVFRRSDERLRTELQQFDVLQVRPEHDPPDMRTSVEHGVATIRETFAPSEHDAWLLIPADHPVIDPNVAADLIDAWSACPADIMVPVYQNRRGHPTFFRWSLTDRLIDIPKDQGLNWLLKSSDVSIHETPVDSESVLFDLDTPDDFKRVEQWLSDVG